MGQMEDKLRQEVLGDDAKKPDTGGKETKKFSDEMEDYRREAVKNRIVFDTWGPSSRSQENKPLGVDEFISNQNKLIISLLDQVTKINTAEHKSPFYDHLEQELRELRSKLDTPADPIGTIQGTMDGLQRLTESLKGQLGFSSSMPVSGMDMGNMLKLADIQEQQAQRHREWEDEKLDRQRRWDMEDRKWATEHDLKKQQVEAEIKQSEKRHKSFSDLANVVAQSIDKESGAEYSAHPNTPQENMVARGFKCKFCKSIIQVQTGQPSVVCPNTECGAIYDMKGSEVSSEPAKHQPTEAQKEPDSVIHQE